MRIGGVSSPEVHKALSNSGEGNIKQNQQGDKRIEFSTQQSEEAKPKKIQEEELIKAIEDANKSVNVYDRKLEFSIHEKTKEIMVKVIDTNSDEVIREIPPEKVLDMVARLWELAGIIVDKKV